MRSIEELVVPTQPIVLCDIDDTLTLDGRLLSESFTAIWNLSNRGIPVIPVTGRPAGWCEMIARQWPVSGVIGENGALYYRYVDGQMKRFYVTPPSHDTRERLNQLSETMLSEVPGCAIASDQFCRLFDLAVDFCEDVPALPKSDVQKIVEIFHKAGATCKVSSIHVNGWFGEFDKLTMARTYLKEELSLSEDEQLRRCIFIGDSPNDEPMFGHFELSVAVANIQEFADDLKSPPKYVAQQSHGHGFVELARHILDQPK